MNKNITLRLTLFGFLFGLSFPLGAIALVILQSHQRLSWQNLASLHAQHTLLWIIDTAPFILATFAYFTGRQYARATRLNLELDHLLKEREALVEQLKNLTTSLKRQTERRFVQLQTASQVAQEANSIHDIKQLLEHIVHLISERFGFYHVGIFMNDRLGQFTVLQAANSEGGRHMLARNHKLRIGEVGIVGYVAAKGEPRIALDVGEDAVYFDNPDLPETRSEMALPIKIAGQVIGVLDIQSKDPGAFDEDDVTVLQTIADSLESAIENARLLSELQSNLEEIRRLHRQYLGHAWSQIASPDQPIEYIYQRDVLLPEARTQKIEIPLKVRDVEIGTLTLEKEVPPSEDERSVAWSEDEIGLIQKVIAQSAQALENSRLLNEAQRLARREQHINWIRSQISASTHPQSILENAVRELGKALRASKAYIQIGTSVPQYAEQTGFRTNPSDPPPNGNHGENPSQGHEDMPGLGSF